MAIEIWRQILVLFFSSFKIVYVWKSWSVVLICDHQGSVPGQQHKGHEFKIHMSQPKYRSIVRKYLKKWLSIYLPLSWCEHRIVPCICGKKCKFEEPTVITHFSLVKLVSIKLYRTIFSPFSSEWELIFYPDWIALLKLGRH